MDTTNFWNINNLPDGFGTGYFATPNGSIPLYPTQYIQNGTFKGYFEVMNGFPQRYQFLVMALVNYKVVPFYYNGTINSTHVVELDPKSTDTYAFNITDIPDGLNDVYFLVFLDPFNNSSSDDYRLTTEHLMTDVRFNVIQGEANKPNINLSNFTKQSESSNSIGDILVNKNYFNSTFWLYQNVTKNDTINYNINTQNDENKSRTFAVIQLLDYNQIPINNNNSEYVYYGSLNKSEAGSINASLIVPNSSGLHQLAVIIFTHPYENLEISPGNYDYSAIAESSIRIGLNVT
jgi:hypothetical protein